MLSRQSARGRDNRYDAGDRRGPPRDARARPARGRHARACLPRLAARTEFDDRVYLRPAPGLFCRETIRIHFFRGLLVTAHEVIKAMPGHIQDTHIGISLLNPRAPGSTYSAPSIAVRSVDPVGEAD